MLEGSEQESSHAVGCGHQSVHLRCWPLDCFCDGGKGTNAAPRGGGTEGALGHTAEGRPLAWEPCLPAKAYSAGLAQLTLFHVKRRLLLVCFCFDGIFVSRSNH